HVDGVPLQLQRAVLEGRVAQAVAEREQRCRRHVQITLVDVVLGPPVSAAPVLAVMDWHLPDVARDRDRQLPRWVRNAEDSAPDPPALMRSAVISRQKR